MGRKQIWTRQSGRRLTVPGRARPVGLLSAPIAAGLGALVLSGAALAGQSAIRCPDPTIRIEHSRVRAVTLMCTGHGFPTRSAATLRGLSDADPHPSFAATGWPRWGVDGFWAPDLERVGDRYLLYYSARRRGDRRHCIGVAVSDRPDGGFRDIGRPLIDYEVVGAIDPALLRVGDQLLLIYKRDGNSVGAPSIIYGLRLSADGLRVAGAKVELLRSRAGGWERGVIEGPTPIRHGHKTYLLYSGGRFDDPGYAEGEAVRVGNPLGRYRRVSSAPVLHGDSRWVGTGGGSIVVDGHRLLLAYNAFPPTERPLRRRLFICELRFEAGILRPVGRPEEIPLRRR